MKTLDQVNQELEKLNDMLEYTLDNVRTAQAWLYKNKAFKPHAALDTIHRMLIDMYELQGNMTDSEDLKEIMEKENARRKKL